MANISSEPSSEHRGPNLGFGGNTGGSLSTSRPLADRPPILSFPTLHLGSFTALSPDSFPSPPPSARPSNTSTLTSPERPGEAWPRSPEGYQGSAAPTRQGSRDGSGGLKLPVAQRRDSKESDTTPPPSASLYPARSRESSKGSIRSRGHLPPPLPPPTTSLPPLPSISPISPLGSNFASSTAPLHIQRPASPMSATAQPVAFSAGSPRGLAPTIASSRPVGAPLAINIPSPSQFVDPEKSSGAVLKSSPGIPRRRTLVEGKKEQGSEARMSGVLGAVETSSRDQGSPEPRLSELRASDSHAPSSPTTHKLEKKASTNNLRESPASPSAKRTLPRPPVSDRPSFDTSARAGPSAPPQPPAITPRSVSKQSLSQTPLSNFQQQPQPSHPQHQQQPQQQNLQAQQHRPTNSASALPIIAGLADAGPYPSSRPNSIKGQQGTLGRGSIPRPPPQEEICLECMMRDRDLADVTVIGDDAWERASNDAWEDAKRREGELLRTLGSVEGASEEDGGEPSPPSTATYSAEDREQEQATTEVRKRREARWKRGQEMDQKVLREIGWRGFKWEEGSSGEGMPRNFRGTKGGRLTEEGIKAVMTKFPSASAHRYNWLQGYLRNQYMLTVDIAAEAKRLGFFPTPVEVVYSSSTSHEAFMPGLKATGSRTSSLAWDGTQPIRQSMEQSQPPMRNPSFPSSPATMPPSLVRPSPSSPADLAMAARAPRTIPVVRPTTHFIPDREPNPNSAAAAAASARQKLNIQTSNNGSLMPSPVPGMGMGMGPRDRYGNSPDLDDGQWPPISPAESGMRPFSFAVRAGAVDRGSDGGHGGRRSIFGRWGGSVTSFFGGSQGGSGSMMDMHLGLDSDRRNQASSQYVHAQPRAVSLASPTRPAFFGRDSRSSSTDNRVPQAEQRGGRSTSTSRLSQVLRTEDEPAQARQETPKKDKGLRGLLKKMKPKSRKSLNGSGAGGRDMAASSMPYRPQQQYSEYQSQPQQQQQQQYRQAEHPSSQLQPPPSLNYLVGGGDRQHNRNRSGSSSSMVDSQDPAGRPNSTVLPGPGVGNGGMRSVSAPFAGSSSGGSPNNSPTSSRFDKYGNPTNGSGGVRRSSYASLSNRPGSGYEAELARESIVEVLSGQGQREMGGNGSYAPSSRLSEGYDRPPSAGPNGYAQSGYRPTNKTNSSLSASSVVVTPPPPSQQQQQLYVNTGPSGAYFAQQQHGRANHAKTPSDQLSPDRFKNLPPLPPPGGDDAPPNHQQQQQQQYSGLPTPRQQSRPGDQQHVPRASFDPAPSSQRGYDHHPSPRLAQSMYAQPTGAASVGSLGSFARGYAPASQYSQGEAYGGMQQGGRYEQHNGGGQKGQQWGYGQQGEWDGNENVVDLGGNEGQGKGTMGRRGLKGLFGKAGRLA